MLDELFKLRKSRSIGTQTLETRLERDWHLPNAKNQNAVYTELAHPQTPFSTPEVHPRKGMHYGPENLALSPRSSPSDSSTLR